MADTTPASNPASVLSSMTPSSIGAAAGAAVAKASGFSLDSPTRWIMVALGLLLIAAGIFSFDKTKEVIVTAGKRAVEAAAAA